MNINPNRSKQAQEIIFSRKLSKVTHPPMFFNTNIVSQINSQQHLGVILDVKLTFEQHLKNVFNKTNKKIGLLRKLSNLLPRQTLVTIYKAFARSHLIMVKYSISKLLTILSAQKWNRFNMFAQQLKELFEVHQEKKSAKNQAYRPFYFVVGSVNFVSFINFSKMNIQNTFLILFL